MSNSDTVPQPEYMLTTVDNPYDPFTQFDEWYMWDQNAGYATSGLLARISYTSGEISEADQFLAVQQAIDEVARENVSGVHKKVQRGEVVVGSDSNNASEHPGQ